MTIKELENLCHQLEFTGDIGDCVRNALYCELDQNIYSGPTLIYCPPEHKYVYVSPKSQPFLLYETSLFLIYYKV
jgi:hypothetical protein